MSVDPQTFKAVMGQWPSGVTVVTTLDADGPAGMTASSFSSVSLDPPLVSICIARPLQMHARIEKAGKFAVNILSKDKVDDGRRFAGMLPGVTNRFEGLSTTTAVTGCPLLPGMLGWVDCTLWAKYDGGDHTIFIGQVQAAGIDPTAAPLLYHSRNWGQFADVLTSEANLIRAGAEGEAVIIDNAFGPQADAPLEVDRIVSRVREALGSTTPLLVLDDRVGAADPLLLRLVLQAIGRVVGRTPVALRPAAGAMALANILVGLKSGVRHIVVSAQGQAPYVAEGDVRTMLGRMGVVARG